MLHEVWVCGVPGTVGIQRNIEIYPATIVPYRVCFYMHYVEKI